MPETEAPKARAFRTRKVLIILVSAAAIVIALSGLVLAGVTPLSTILSCIGTPGTSRSFTLIANSTGYNNSVPYQQQHGLSAPWPVMNVSRCDNVTINVTNHDTQTHGLAVGGYTNEYTIAPGQDLSIHFTANKTGHWRVYCTILCSIHDYMVNGQLNVG